MLNYKPEKKCKRAEKKMAEKWRTRFLDSVKRGADGAGEPSTLTISTLGLYLCASLTALTYALSQFIVLAA